MLKFPYFVKTKEGRIVPNMFMLIYIIVPSLFAIAAWSQQSWSFGKAMYFIAIFAFTPAFFNLIVSAFENITGKRTKSFYSKPE